MDLTPIQLKIAGAVLGFSVLVLATSASFLIGTHQGENNINVRWQAEKLAHGRAIAKLEGEIKQQEFGHRQETDRIAGQLRKTEVDYEKASTALASEHALRLRQSAERARAYTAQAEAGPDQCRDLAGHAAGLDAALEEGRGLVGELKAALGRREDQLRLLGAQIINDRKLLDGQ